MTKSFDHIDSLVALETRNGDSQKCFQMKVDSHANGGGEVMLETESQQWSQLEWPKGDLEDQKW